MVFFFRRLIRLIGPFGGLVFIRREFLRRGNFFIYLIINIII